MIKRSKTILLILIFGYTFLFTPLILLILNSFGDSEIPGIWSKLTLKWFKIALQDNDLIKAALTSLKIATISATISIILGITAAITTNQQKEFFGKNFLNSIIVLPIVMPEIIVGFSLLMLFIIIEKSLNITIERGFITVCIGHIIATMAYVHMNIKSKLLVLDVSIEEAAQNLGAKPFSVFWKIKLPMLSKTILSSWILSFTISLDDLVIASFLTGTGSTTLPILIFSNVRTGITPVINAFATMFIVIVIICIVITYIFSKKKN